MDNTREQDNPFDWYYWKNGWYFRRNKDHSVSIYRKNPKLPAENSPFFPIMDIPYNEWCTIIAHVSSAGNIESQYNRAINFHEGD